MTLFMPLVAIFLSLPAPLAERALEIPAPILCFERVICHRFHVAAAAPDAATPVPRRFIPRNPP